MGQSQRLIDLLRSADWLHAERATLYARLLFFTTAAVVLAMIVVSVMHGGLDPRGELLGTDFASFWAASKLALAGHPVDAWNISAHHAAQTAIVGRDTGYAAFFYPPTYLLVCLPLAFLPYLWSLLAWVVVTGFAYVRVARAWLGDKFGWLVIGAFPAVFSNLGHGQNAFLSGALMGSGALWLNSRPILAGVCFGAMAWKPHLAIAAPFALIAARRWNTFAAAAVTAVTLTGLSVVVFGMGAWQGFAADSALGRATLEQGLVDPGKMQSVFAAVRLWNGPLSLAYGLQAVAALGAIGILFLVQKRDFRGPSEGAALITATLIISPFLLDYDLTLLAFPLAWMLREGARSGFRPWEKIALLAAFLLPVLSRSLAMGLHLPTAPVVIGALMLLILRRATAPAAQSANFPVQGLVEAR
jgi:alpha-1,2-mannosyltransferase